MKTVYVKEASIVYRRTRVEDVAIGKAVCSSRDVARIASRMIGTNVTERFVVVGLDPRNRIIGWCIVGQGSSTFCPVDASEVVRFLALSCADACVLVHNHPSGDTEPSSDDIALTRRIQEVTDLIDVKTLDHVIVTDDPTKAYSFLDANLMAR